MYLILESSSETSWGYAFRLVLEAGEKKPARWQLLEALRAGEKNMPAMDQMVIGHFPDKRTK
jgi:hypothetical protein